MSQAEALVGDSVLRVLLVDGNGAFLQAATDLLKRCPDLVVVSTPCGDQRALALARDLQPQVILLDLDMPDLVGLEAMQQLRDLMPGAAIIALTSLEGFAPIGAARAAGARDVVSKAALTTDLLPAIQRATAPHPAPTRQTFALRQGEIP